MFPQFVFSVIRVLGSPLLSRPFLGLNSRGLWTHAQGTFLRQVFHGYLWLTVFVQVSYPLPTLAIGRTVEMRHFLEFPFFAVNYVEEGCIQEGCIEGSYIERGRHRAVR